MRFVVAVVALVTCLHAGLWSLLHRQYSSPDFHGQLASVSYSPYTRWQHPDNGDRPSAEQIRSDQQAALELYDDGVKDSVDLSV